MVIGTGDVTGEVNPARAGMIPERVLHPVLAFRKPRASGDDPNAARADADVVR